MGLKYWHRLGTAAGTYTFWREKGIQLWTKMYTSNPEANESIRKNISVKKFPRDKKTIFK